MSPESLGESTEDLFTPKIIDDLFGEEDPVALRTEDNLRYAASLPTDEDRLVHLLVSRERSQRETASGTADVQMKKLLWLERDEYTAEIGIVVFGKPERFLQQARTRAAEVFEQEAREQAS